MQKKRKKKNAAFFLVAYKDFTKGKQFWGL